MIVTLRNVPCFRYATLYSSIGNNSTRNSAQHRPQYRRVLGWSANTYQGLELCLAAHSYWFASAAAAAVVSAPSLRSPSMLILLQIPFKMPFSSALIPSQSYSPFYLSAICGEIFPDSAAATCRIPGVRAMMMMVMMAYTEVKTISVCPGRMDGVQSSCVYIFRSFLRYHHPYLLVQVEFILGRKWNTLLDDYSLF